MLQRPTNDPSVDELRQSLQQKEAEFNQRIQEAVIESTHPDWLDKVKSQEFAGWFASQPADVQSLGDSPFGRDVVKVLNMFEKSQASPASGIRQQREARLSVAATPRASAPAPKSVDDMSPQEIWELEARRREKRR